MMSTHTPTRLVALLALVVAACFATPPPAQANTIGGNRPPPYVPAVRPALGEILKDARNAINDRRFSEALALIDQAEQVQGDPLTPYELYIINHLRGSAAASAGNVPLAYKAFNIVLDSSFMPTEQQLPILAAMVRMAFSARDYDTAVRAVARYREAGGTDPEALEIEPQALYLAKRYDEAATIMGRQVQRKIDAGTQPSEQELQVLASSAIKNGDLDGYLAALRLMVTYFPADTTWLDLIIRTEQRSDFSDRYTLDVYRLREQTGTLLEPSDYMEAVQLALQAGYPGDAQRMLQSGYVRGVLGRDDDVGKERQERLRELVDRKVAEDRATLAEGEALAAQADSGDALVNTGYNLVGYGEYQRGIALMNRGIEKGGLVQPNEARLRLGHAYYMAGMKQEALKIFSSIKGDDGSGALAGLWSILAREG
ncbi:hypothetical protein JN531_000235 [Flagellatimonas centrodinii]|uniref:hypothetical protein n=1 Tax=Flagellatimonas centrodinii TaxID=2806210 RepID=UPI001FEF8FD5|nr:hypothetical protein [Flagellatimonas centrodinii]ULQ46735.1 hypothetical protein JN531_000235 [Flagellatimonas centrodinii]